MIKPNQIELKTLKKNYIQDNKKNADYFFLINVNFQII